MEMWLFFVLKNLMNLSDFQTYSTLNHLNPLVYSNVLIIVESTCISGKLNHWHNLCLIPSVNFIE